MPSEEEFFMVWRDGGTGPTKRHESPVDAMNEAERLALLSPGVKFYVLTAHQCVVVERPVTWTDLKVYVPF